jgi:hypothetical protein
MDIQALAEKFDKYNAEVSRINTLNGCRRTSCKGV